MRHNAKVDFAAVGKGNSSQGCAGILLPHR